LFCDNDVNDNKTASAAQTKKISENQGIDSQRLLNELIDVVSENTNQYINITKFKTAGAVLVSTITSR